MGEQEITEYLVTLLTEITGNLNKSPSPLDNTPFLSSEVGTSFEELERLSKGQVDLAVADPISESDLNGRMFVFGANAGALTDIGVTQQLLGRALRPLVGELWIQTRIQRQVGDILADVGLQSYHLALSPPSLQTNPSAADANQTASPFHYVQVRRSETLSRQVEIVGPPKFSANSTRGAARRHHDPDEVALSVVARRRLSARPRE